MVASKPHFFVRLLPSLTDVAFLMPLAFLFLRMGGAAGMLGDGDTGWHVKTGEWILANRRIPNQDIFSYTKAGQPWFAWEWLWDLSFGWLHQHAGMAAVILTSILVLCCTSALLFRLVRRECGNALLAISIMFLVTGASAIHWLARPHLFTLLFAVIFYSLLERVNEGHIRLLWWLPALMLVWTNLHGGFFVGLILVGAYAGGELLRALFEARIEAARRAIPYLLAGAGCLLATFVNPYSYHLHAHIFEYLTDRYQYRNIVEFQSFNFHHPVTVFFEPMLLLGLAAVIWSLARRDYVHALLVAGWAHLALVAVRNTPIFMMVASVPVAAMLQKMIEDLPASNLANWLRLAASRVARFAAEFGATDSIPRLHLASAGAACFLVALFYAPNAPAMCRAQYDAARYPAKAVEFLQKDGSADTIFTDDTWGGYLIYRLYPANKVFIDGRSDFYGSTFNEKYLDVMKVRYGWEKNLDQYHVNAILLPVETPLTATLKESPRWRAVYDDGVAILFRIADATAAGGNQFSAVSHGGKDRGREITKPQHVISRSPNQPLGVNHHENAAV
ncbi:MAG TPA: hypothetical protein VK335_23845 [Bryobacteraceae bacterium]|nr:hypothetical protein [Bryobacteraceae bacterium]